MQTLNPSAALLSLPPPSRAAGATILRELPAPGELPPYTANLLGPRRAELARALRQRLQAAGLSWPRWIDARPGRLQVLLGDLCDPPLGQSAAELAARHGALLLDGIAALGLITGVSRLELCASAPATLKSLRALCAGSTVTVQALPAVYPPTPESFVAGAGEHAYVAPAAQLARIGALVREVPAPRLCTIAGAVARPQVVVLSADAQDRAPSFLPTGPGEPAGAQARVERELSELTPAALVRRCGGARTAAWVAVVDGALGGVLWPAEQRLPLETALCLILPTAHPLVARLRRGEQWRTRARNACLSCQACTDFCPVAQSGVPLSPHRLMRALAAAPSADGETLASGEGLAAREHAAACTGCGACSAMCPAELLPGALVRTLAATPGGAVPDAALVPAFSSAQPRIPLPLLLSRLGLSEYAPAE